jgi:nucleotide-binding universal stress UspA family protein
VILAAPHVGDGQREPYGWSTEAVLREAHTPTIVVPTSAKGNSGCDRIMIAWNASSESHRAVADAMPLLEAASVVRVLTIEAKVGVHGHGDEPGADIARHLAKHNVQVDVDRVEHVSGSLADTILHRSYDFTADLLVAGAFGHSRASHIVFGSTTSDLLALSPIPIFFSR